MEFTVKEESKEKEKSVPTDKLSKFHLNSVNCGGSKELLKLALRCISFLFLSSK